RLIRSSVRRCCPELTPLGELRNGTGERPPRRSVPWYVAGRKPLPHAGAPPLTQPPGSGSTTNAGMFWFSVPSPYVAHAPRLGLPMRIDPVFIRYTDSGCVTLSP